MGFLPIKLKWSKKLNRDWTGMESKSVGLDWTGIQIDGTGIQILNFTLTGLNEIYRVGLDWNGIQCSKIFDLYLQVENSLREISI